MGEGEKGPPLTPSQEERIRSLMREMVQNELLEWRLALQQIVRRQEEMTQALAKIERMLPSAVGIVQSAADSTNGFESERRRLELFLQQMERSYREGKMTEIELLRGRERVRERLELLGQAEEEAGAL